MKIRFIGTSHGVPGDNRHCQCILIEQGDSTYIIDAGAPVADILINEGYDLTRIKAVFITHIHGDHVDGLVQLCDLVQWKFKEAGFTVYLPECADIFDAFISKTDVKNDGRVVYKEIQAGDVFDDGNIRLTAHPTDHLKRAGRPALGYLIEEGGRRLYITGDMSHRCDDFPVGLLSDYTDAVITECAHFPAEKLMAQVAKCSIGTLIPIHVFPLEKYDDIASLSDTVRCKIYCPRDNDTFEM